MMFEYDLSAKWLELLKQIAPTVTRAAVLRDAAVAAGIGQFAVIQSVARSVGVDVKAINLLRDPAEIENSVASFARAPNGGLILTASALSAVHRDRTKGRRIFHQWKMAGAVACPRSTTQGHQRRQTRRRSLCRGSSSGRAIDEPLRSHRCPSPAELAAI